MATRKDGQVVWVRPEDINIDEPKSKAGFRPNDGSSSSTTRSGYSCMSPALQPAIGFGSARSSPSSEFLDDFKGA